MYTLPFVLKLYSKIKDSSLKKADIKKVDINKVLLDCNLSYSTRILFCVVKIYTKKGKYLLEDCSELLMRLGSKKEIKHVKKTLKTEEEDVYISDIVIPEMSLNDNYDVVRDDYDLVSVGDCDLPPQSTDLLQSTDLINDSTLMKDSTLIKDFNIPLKRRKLVDDSIEYDTKYYRDVVCNNKIRDLRVIPTYNFNIPAFFNERLRVTVEKMRDETALEEYSMTNINDLQFDDNNYNEVDDININDINYNEVDDINYNEVDDINYNEVDDINYNDIDLPITLLDIPSPFNFNDQVDSFSREEKARLFFDLLKKVSSGVLEVEQKSPSESIICTSK